MLTEADLFCPEHKIPMIFLEPNGDKICPLCEGEKVQNLAIKLFLFFQTELPGDDDKEGKLMMRVLAYSLGKACHVAGVSPENAIFAVRVSATGLI